MSPRVRRRSSNDSDKASTDSSACIKAVPSGCWESWAWHTTRHRRRPRISRCQLKIRLPVVVRGHSRVDAELSSTFRGRPTRTASRSPRAARNVVGPGRRTSNGSGLPRGEGKTELEYRGWGDRIGSSEPPNRLPLLHRYQWLVARLSALDLVFDSFQLTGPLFEPAIVAMLRRYDARHGTEFHTNACRLFGVSQTLSSGWTAF
jgi:hypothetical protein